MDQNRACCNKSRVGGGLMKIPGGLDRSWETKRLQGLEMLGQSVELQKERINQKSAVHDLASKKRSRHKKRYGTSGVMSQLFQVTSDSNEAAKSKMHEDYVLRLEYQVQELGKQLIVERQKSRQDKLNMARLQQELARHKSERPFKDMLTKELEREHQLRLETERRLSRLMVECNGYKQQLSALEADLKKMTEVAPGFPSGVKIRLEDQESEGIAGSYDGNTQHSSDDGEKSKVLLERLRMLETEKTSLVLENEHQSQMYEKCLDNITTQVLEALMAQQSLKDECYQLQNRVLNLQQQNVQLRNVFQKHFMTNADAFCLEAGASANENADHKQQAVVGEIRMSINSLNSVFSDQDQMNYLMSRINSPSYEFTDCSLALEPNAANARSDFLSQRHCHSAAAAAFENCDGKEAESKMFRVDDDGKTCLGNENRGPNQRIDEVDSLDRPKDQHSHQGSVQKQRYLHDPVPEFKPSQRDNLAYRANLTNQDITDSSSSHRRKTDDRKAFVRSDFGEPLSDSDGDDDTTCVPNQKQNQFDTESTVSLNELLDLAATEFDYENVNDALADFSQIMCISGPAVTNLTETPNFVVKKEVTGVGSKGQRIWQNASTGVGHVPKVSLPDVCPDDRGSKPL